VLNERFHFAAFDSSVNRMPYSSVQRSRGVQVACRKPAVDSVDCSKTIGVDATSSRVSKTPPNVPIGTRAAHEVEERRDRRAVRRRVHRGELGDDREIQADRLHAVGEIAVLVKDAREHTEVAEPERHREFRRAGARFERRLRRVVAAERVLHRLRSEVDVDRRAHAKLRVAADGRERPAAELGLELGDARVHHVVVVFRKVDRPGPVVRFEIHVGIVEPIERLHLLRHAGEFETGAGEIELDVLVARRQADAGEAREIELHAQALAVAVVHAVVRRSS